jgi:hypothetical protein
MMPRLLILIGVAAFAFTLGYFIGFQSGYSQHEADHHKPWSGVTYTPATQPSGE